MQSVNSKTIPADILFPMLETILQEGKEVSFTITGNSMWPLLLHGRDSVVLERFDADDLRVGDMVLFRTPLGNYIFHRVSKISGDTFETIGDGNCFKDGFFAKEAIIGRADLVIRKGKKIRCKSFGWRIVFRVWLWLFPIRRSLLRLFQFRPFSR